MTETTSSQRIFQPCAVTLLLSCVLAAQQQPPVFRGRVSLVPVDVRVIDRDGDPVRDLNVEDFTVLENDTEQTISVFSTEEHVAEPAGRGSEARVDAAPVAPRTFVIVLGRGRLQGPSKGFDALLEFIDNTPPQDRLAVAAYDRVTELTTDRQAIRRLVERYRSEHEDIEALLDHWFRGLTAFYGGQETPPRIQARIDTLFDMPGLPAMRYLEYLTASGVMKVERQMALESMGRGDTSRRRGFVFNTAARQDLEKLYATIEYLRPVDGEKHVILLTAEGLLSVMPATSDRLARLATDARVTLSTIQTGGLPSRFVSGGRGRPAILEGPTWAHLWANADTRARAEETGGIASAYEYADKTFDRIERATRFRYELGYYPADTELNGEYRRISVKVNRPDVRVLYRHGYYARKDPVGLDRREHLTESRISAAAGYRAVLRDIPLSLSAIPVRGEGSKNEVRAEVRIAPGALTFTDADGAHVASIDVALFVGADRERSIGELRKRVDLRLTPANFQRVLLDGVVFSGTVAVEGEPRHVKAVVYEYQTDRLGSAVIEIKR